MGTLFVGIDVAEVKDFTAICILERTQPPGEKRYHHAVRHLERMRGLEYPRQVERVAALMGQPALAGALLIADATGVGLAATDLFREAKLPVRAIVITGGDQVTREGYSIRVPKRDIVSVLQVAFQTNRLKVAQELKLAQTLLKELLDFRLKIDPITQHDSYGCWRSGQNDDLVLACGLAVWYAEKGATGFTPYAASTKEREMNPLQAGDDPYTHALLGSVTVKGPSNPAFDWMEYRSDREGGR